MYDHDATSHREGGRASIIGQRGAFTAVGAHFIAPTNGLHYDAGAMRCALAARNISVEKHFRDPLQDENSAINGKIIGIVTEADIISKVNREGLCVADIMSHEVISVGEETA